MLFSHEACCVFSWQSGVCQTRATASVCSAVVLCSSAESSQVSQRESYGFSVLGCSPVLISRVESGESERELRLQRARL